MECRRVLVRLPVEERDTVLALPSSRKSWRTIVDDSCWRTLNRAVPASGWSCRAVSRYYRKPVRLKPKRQPCRRSSIMTHDILIVDDEEDICKLIAGILQDEGYETREAANSSTALAAIAARQPSLVILDVWLQNSEYDGLQMLEIIRRDHPARKSTRLHSSH